MAENAYVPPARPAHADYDVRTRPYKRTSWGAIFAGAAIALVLEILIAVLGIAIGLSTVDPATEPQPFGGLGVGAMIWWILTGIIGMFAGGCAAARLAGSPQRSTGALHGAAVWAVVTLVTVYLLYSAVGAVIGGAWNVLHTGAMSATQVQPGAVQEVRQELQGQPAEEAGEAAQQVRQAATQAVQAVTPQTVAERSAAAAWWTFFMLLIGGVAAVVGGIVGPPKHALPEERR